MGHILKKLYKVALRRFLRWGKAEGNRIIVINLIIQWKFRNIKLTPHVFSCLALHNMNFFPFFVFCGPFLTTWIPITNGFPNPDPQTQLNPDPNPWNLPTLLPNLSFKVTLLPNWCFKVTLPPNWCFKVTLLPNWCFTLRYFPINAYIKEAMCLPCCGQAGRSGRRKGRCLAASGGTHNASAAAYRAHSPHTPYCSSETIYKVNTFHTYGLGTSASEREQNLQYKELTT